MDSTKDDPSMSKGGDEVNAIISPARSDNDVEASVAANAAQYIPDSKLEKQLLRKVDLCIMPTLWLMCVLAYVDRNNIVCLNL
jgi:hypothetical protein